MVGEPGFTKEAMTALKAKVLAEKTRWAGNFCLQMLDGMARSTDSLLTLMMIHCPKSPKSLCL